MSTVQVSLQAAGFCTCPHFLALSGGPWKTLPFPATFAVLEHPREGIILYDTGYSQRFFEETRRFPSRMYRWLTPVTLKPDETAVSQLASRGLSPRDVSKVIISHFHADHISALADFPKARYVYLPQAWQAVTGRTGFSALSKAYLPGLLPSDFRERSDVIDPSRLVPLPPEWSPWTHGYDLLGDGSLTGVELPGHARGQLGVICRRQSQIPVFFVADAAWLSVSLEQDRPPHPAANLIFDDAAAYRTTLTGLHQLRIRQPELVMVPSHCQHTLDTWRGIGHD